MKTPILQTTKNYSQFKPSPYNRSVERIGKLKKSMEKHGFLPAYPLHCVRNGTGLIIKDGQHRYAVAESLGLPVYYVVVESEADISIPEINAAQRAWTISDYVSSFCNVGNPNYQRLRAFKEDSGLPMMICVSLLVGHDAASKNKRDEVKGGTFKIKDAALPLATSVARMVNETGEHVHWAKNSLYVDALSKCCRVEGFIPDTFTQKMSATPGLLKLQPTTEDFLNMIEAIYNHRAHKRIPLKFMAGVISKKRNPVKAK